MTWQISARLAAKANKEKNRGNGMSAVDFGQEIAGQYVRKMVEIESRGHGDQLNALDRVSRLSGLSSRSLRRLLNGETKDPTFSVIARLQRAYYAVCDRQISKLMNEVQADKARYGDAAYENFDRKIEALSEELQRAKERAKG